MGTLASRNRCASKLTRFACVSPEQRLNAGGESSPSIPGHLGLPDSRPASRLRTKLSARAPLPGSAFLPLRGSARLRASWEELGVGAGGRARARGQGAVARRREAGRARRWEASGSHSAGSVVFAAARVSLAPPPAPPPAAARAHAPPEREGRLRVCGGGRAELRGPRVRTWGRGMVSAPGGAGGAAAAADATAAAAAAAAPAPASQR